MGVKLRNGGVLLKGGGVMVGPDGCSCCGETLHCCSIRCEDRGTLGVPIDPPCCWDDGLVLDITGHCEVTCSCEETAPGLVTSFDFTDSAVFTGATGGSCAVVGGEPLVENAVDCPYSDEIETVGWQINVWPEVDYSGHCTGNLVWHFIGAREFSFIAEAVGPCPAPGVTMTLSSTYTPHPGDDCPQTITTSVSLTVSGTHACVDAGCE